MSLSVRNGTKRSLPTVGATILHFLACHFAHVNTTSCSGTDGSVVGHLSLKVQLSGFRLFHGLGPGPMARYVYSSMNDLVHVTLYKCKSFLCRKIYYKITQTVIIIPSRTYELAVWRWIVIWPINRGHSMSYSIHNTHLFGILTNIAALFTLDVCIQRIHRQLHSKW